MEEWGVGLQKGLVYYDKETYDREVSKMEGDDLEMLKSMQDAEEAENEAYKMTGRNDDDYDEGMDGDEEY